MAPLKGVSEKLHAINVSEESCRSRTVASKTSPTVILPVVQRPRRRFGFCLFVGSTAIVLLILILLWYRDGVIPYQITRVACVGFSVDSTDGDIAALNSWELTEQGIPKIFHQTYKTELLPMKYMPLVTKCRQLNFDWQYILWRDQDILTFVKKHFPQYLAKFTGFKMSLQRADMLRYMVLYHYGGVYTDMDVECVRPFFPGLASSAASVALLDQERPEHANILYGREFTAMNSAMAAPPRHPFFLEVLRTIESVDEDVPSIGWSTGPELVTAVYKKWIKGPNSVRHPVKLLSPEVFSPLTDSYDFVKKCSNMELGNLETSEQVSWFKAGCRLVAAKNWSSDITSSNTIGRHQFLHLGYSWSQHKLAESIHCNISALHPNVKYFTTENG